MRTPAGEGPSGPRPALRLSPGPGAVARRQPIPRETLVLHQDGATYVARTWDDRDEAARDCRLCPRDVCCLTPGGACLVRLEGFVPTVFAPLRPMSAPGLGLAAVRPLALGREGAGG